MSRLSRRCRETAEELKEMIMHKGARTWRVIAAAFAAVGLFTTGDLIGDQPAPAVFSFFRGDFRGSTRNDFSIRAVGEGI